MLCNGRLQKNMRSAQPPRGFSSIATFTIALMWSTASMAHGFAGQRFFPATIATDDPFVADELSFPTVTSSRFGGSGEDGRQTTIAVNLAKRITDNFGLELGGAHERFAYRGAQPRRSGFDNLEIGAKYQFYRNDAAESLVSGGLVWEVGGSGSKSIADSFSSYTPTLYFGKGFGQLEQAWLRPLAVTGTLGISFPGRASTVVTSTDPDTGTTVSAIERNPHTLQVGLALEYSLPYLQSAVKDVGLGVPWNRLVPVVEIAAQKPLDRVESRSWTGTVNPGLLWVGRYVQIGLEAVIPVNRSSGRGVGAQAQLHLFLDDLFPHTFGRPLL